MNNIARSNFNEKVVGDLWVLYTVHRPTDVLRRVEKLNNAVTVHDQ